MLWRIRQDFILDVHFAPNEMSPYINVNGRYSYNELEKIFDETDVLIAPSMWYETFGYTVLEALSYGVPVIISGTVGTKDILAEGCGIVIDDITPEKLCRVLENLNMEKLKSMNKTIYTKQDILTIEKMDEMIEEQCY